MLRQFVNWRPVWRKIESKEKDDPTSDKEIKIHGGSRKREGGGGGRE